MLYMGLEMGFTASVSSGKPGAVMLKYVFKEVLKNVENILSSHRNF